MKILTLLLTLSLAFTTFHKSVADTNPQQPETEQPQRGDGRCD